MSVLISKFESAVSGVGGELIPEGLPDAGTVFTKLGEMSSLWMHIKIYESGGENNLHAHPEEDHAFYVLEGRAEFTNDQGDLVEVGPHEGVLIPAGTAYAFRTLDGHLVLFRVGAASLAESRQNEITGKRVEAADPDAEIDTQGWRPYRAGRVSYGAGPTVLTKFDAALTESDETLVPLGVPGGGTYLTELGTLSSLWMHIKIYPSGGENRLHAHPVEDHAFYVLEGSALFTNGLGENVAAGPNEGVVIPAGAQYCFNATGGHRLVLLRLGAASVETSRWDEVKGNRYETADAS